MSDGQDNVVELEVPDHSDDSGGTGGGGEGFEARLIRLEERSRNFATREDIKDVIIAMNRNAWKVIAFVVATGVAIAGIILAI